MLNEHGRVLQTRPFVLSRPKGNKDKQARVCTAKPQINHVKSVRSPCVKHIVPILGLFCLTLLYFSDVLSGDFLLVERDLTTFFYPFRSIWVESVRQGHFPFWNPYIKCGVPLFATAQPGVLYPLSLLYFILPLDLAFNWTIILHFFLAGLFTYMLLNDLGASMRGALAAAIAFAFSGYLIAAHNLLNTLISVSWYPLVMLCGCRMVRTGRMRWTVATGVSTCSMFLGGGVEIVLFALASLLILCLYPLVLPTNPSEDSPKLSRRLGLFGIALVVFLGLSMVQFLPFLELYLHSHRYGGVSLAEATRWSLAPRDLIYFLFPDIYGQRISPDRYWQFQNYLKSIYVGPIVVLLASIYFAKQGRGSLILLAGILVTLVFALGKYTPIYPFFYRYFPLFATLRYPVKFIFLLCFWLCVAAGLGLDCISRYFSKYHQPVSWLNRLQGLLVVSAIVMAGILIFTRFFPEQAISFGRKWMSGLLDPAYLSMALHNFNRVLFFTLLASMALFFGFRHKLTRHGSLLLLILLAADLFLGNRGYFFKLESGSFHGENDIIRTLKADPDLFRFHVFPSVKELDVTVNSYEDFHRARKEFLAFDLMMEHHLFDIDGYNVPLQPRYEKFINLIRGQPLTPSVASLLNLLNVKYVLTAKPIDVPGYGWVQNGLATSRLYKNSNNLPRAFLVKDHKVVDREEEFARFFSEPDFDPGRTALLEATPKRFEKLKNAPSLPDVIPAVKLKVYEHNRMIIEVDTPEAALLFMSEAYYPGWKAYVDKEQEEILRANYVFRAIPVGPGSHRIEVIYDPVSFKVGLSITMATLLVLLISQVVLRRFRGRI